MNKYFVLILLIVNSCDLKNKDKDIIKFASCEYINVLCKSKICSDKSIIKVTETNLLNDIKIFKIEEFIFSSKEKFLYNYDFRCNGKFVYVILNENNKKSFFGSEQSGLSENEKENIFFDPFIKYLIINPINDKHFTFEDDQRYLTDKELLVEIQKIVESNDFK